MATHQLAESSLARRADGSLVAWGLIGGAPYTPATQNHVAAIACGYDHDLAIRTGPFPPLIDIPPSSSLVQNGGSATFSVQAFGGGTLAYQWQFNGVNIAGATQSTLALTDVQAINQGAYQVVISNAAGTNTSSVATLAVNSARIHAWGDNAFGQTNVPPFLPTARAIAAGYEHTLALQTDGTVQAWGNNGSGQTSVPAGLTNVLAIAAGADHSLALRANGTVVGWGRNSEGQASPPAGLTNVSAISAGFFQSMALKRDGTVVTWGQDLGPAPANLTNVTAIAAGYNFNVALKADGTVVAWGGNEMGQTNVPASLTNVAVIAAGVFHALAVRTDGSVVGWGYNGAGEITIPGNLTNVMSVAAGFEFSLALRHDGSVVAWGENLDGQLAIPAPIGPGKSVAAGWFHSVALNYSPLIQYYPLTAAQDMLLIYNTNSTDSATVLNYYLAHRPMAAAANVVGIGYANTGTNTGYYETISTTEITNAIFAPINAWLNANPTKKPQYVILFLDVPSRVVEPQWNYFPTGGSYPQGPAVAIYPSVQMQIHSFCKTNWTPLVSSINMSNKADCVAYIDKIAALGVQNSHGSLMIATSVGVTPEKTFIIDNVRQAIYGGDVGILQSEALSLESQFTPITVTYTDNGAPIITKAADISGYASWGTHDGVLGPTYATDGSLLFTGQSSAYLMFTQESFNGRRFEADQGTFLTWFTRGAFGGADYSCTPIGAITSVDEPGRKFLNHYFVNWAAGVNACICGWNTPFSFLQIVGEPLVTISP